MSAQTDSDPISTLLAEHETATARLDAFRYTLTRAVADEYLQARQALADLRDILLFLDHDVEQHIRKEDVLFAHLTAAMPAPSPLMGEMAGEHEQVRLRTAGLALLRTLHIHFRNEERVVFPLARRLLSAAELSAVAQEFVRQSTKPGAH